MFLHLHFLLLRPSFPCPTVFALPCCRLYYLTLSKPGQAHHKDIVCRYSKSPEQLPPGQIKNIHILYPYGGPGGNRTLVQHAFASKELQQFFKRTPTVYLLQSWLLTIQIHDPRCSPFEYLTDPPPIFYRNWKLY
jgi:hypothetical protein